MTERNRYTEALRSFPWRRDRSQLTVKGKFPVFKKSDTSKLRDVCEEVKVVSNIIPLGSLGVKGTSGIGKD